MYELVKITDNNYYIESPAKVGVIVRGNDAYLIDSGNDKDAGKKIKRVLDGEGWTLRAVFNTHSHADHIGGNAYLQKQTGCRIYGYGIEEGFTKHPILEPAFLYGGNPPKELLHKFLMAQESKAEPLTESVLPEGVEIISLPGHCYDMVGFKTCEGVVYLADCLSNESTLKKYKIGYIFDVAAYIETLEKVKNMAAKMFVPSHAVPCENIEHLAQINIDNTLEIGDKIVVICALPKTFEELLEALFGIYGVKMTFEQYALVGSTVKSYLTWLKDLGRISAEINGNKLIWRSI